MRQRKAAATTPKTDAANDAALREKAALVCDRLDDEYGILEWRSHGEPLGALVMTILSQHTSDKNSERAYDNLRNAYATWDDVREAPVAAIADTIRSGGLADAKAPRIKNVLGEINEKTGATNLDFLRDMPTEEGKAYLLGFHGVGPKTMACVMMFSLCRPVLPVDTHVFRVSHRLGLIEKRIGEAKAHDALENLLTPERVYPFHVHMIRHGRRVCVAQKPRCGQCSLADQCDYYRSGGVMGESADRKSPETETRHGMKAETTTTVTTV
ncbi:MAG: endonuclease III [Akkermansiaceae bacterium]|nr:endonuclease III [Armatimonadota bacterium]